EDGQEHANKWVVLALMGTASFMTTLDSSIVNIALPAIARSFAVPVSGAIEWTIIGYLVVMAATVLTLGRLADMIGRKPIFVAGLVIFTLGSALCGAAPSLGLLIAARCFQGLGAALIFAVNTAMVTLAFPARERGRALGINTILVALGVSAGPTIGGVITQFWTWRLIFYVNVPIGAVAALIAFIRLTERPRRGQGRFDPAGALLLAVGLAALTLALSFSQAWGWGSLRLLVALLIAVGALVAAFVVERRVPDPVLSLTLLRQRVFGSATISFMLAMLALFAVSFMMPFYFEDLRGFDALKSGLLLTPLSLTLAVVAPISGTLADRFGSRWLAPSGLGIACLGLLLVSQLTATSTLLDIIWRLVLTGIGQGLFQSPNTRALMSAAPRGEQGEASGILSTARVIGQGLSVALAGAVFAGAGGAVAGSILGTHAPLPASQVAALQHTFVGGFQAALRVCALCAAVGILTALVRGSESAAGSGQKRAAPHATKAADSARVQHNTSAPFARAGTARAGSIAHRETTAGSTLDEAAAKTH
ncbi:MAG TPA: MFS transporter, partial [Chloroflexota bacterium]|nr:MFS transporter [Chloroflexota bacterium]